MHRLIEQGVGDVAQIPLQDDEAIEQIVFQETFLAHHPFGINRPTFNESA